MAKTVVNMADDKLKVLKLALDKIEKDYGKGSVMMLGDKQKDKMDVISTGSIGLDVALGVGGLPCGRIVEIYGPESSGKTTVAIHTIRTIRWRYVRYIRYIRYGDDTCDTEDMITIQRIYVELRR